MCIRTIPYGYVVESGVKVIVADEATVITEVFERYCSGETFKQIADSLTARAIKFFEGNSSWNKNNIARMIDDARYLGTRNIPRSFQPSCIQRLRLAGKEEAQRKRNFLPQQSSSRTSLYAVNAASTSRGKANGKHERSGYVQVGVNARCILTIKRSSTTSIRYSQIP